MTPVRPVVGLLLEQTLGHQTHTDNLRRILPEVGGIDPVFRMVSYGPSHRLRLVPGYSNWTVRAGLRTSRALRDLERTTRLDALFFHTQVVATLAGRWMKRIPSVVSLDATPKQYDGMAEFYDHPLGGRAAESFKLALNRRCFANAAGVVAWSSWCRDSLVGDYGVDPAKVHVIAPGVDVEEWSRPAGRPRGDAVRILFVGGDLRRKGGRQLIEAVRALRQRRGADGPDVVLDLVTGDDSVTPEPWLRVHRGLTPNSFRLIELYEQASIFCLPTLADCLPMVLSEAGAAGLPVVSTKVGAIDEIVHHGDNGLLVTPDDVRDLSAALESLVDDPDRRVGMGERAAQIVAERFDAEANASRLVELMCEVASSRATPQRTS